MVHQDDILKHIDTDYSYRLAKRLENFKSNDRLGYRTACSSAEFDAGEMLRNEMWDIGLKDVHKDAVTADKWEFKKAILYIPSESGEYRQLHLGAYQTTLVTNGPEKFNLVYLGKGTLADYAGKDVTGKLVLVDINQRDEWWISYPVYQAYLKGARALIAVQSGGYGEVDDTALNAQDIAGPEFAPAFSISRKDAGILKELLEQTGEIDVELDSDTKVTRDCTTYNISGIIPGVHNDRAIMLSAHYDSYFSGFQDDNTGVSMMLGIAKTLIQSGFRPNNTIIFCAMAAEEWGVADSCFDWSTGAYEQVFTAHPEWVGKVIADLNFELPALAHGTRARIRSCYEYEKFLGEFLTELPDLTKAYPEETKVTSPIETWSDDFSIAISGIPSMVNDFTGGSFMETNYHSQFDNDTYYDEQVYRLHHELFSLLILALDSTAIVPLCFSPVIKKIKNIIDANELFKEQELAEISQNLCRLSTELLQKAEGQYEKISELNSRYRGLINAGDIQGAEALYMETRELEHDVLKKFKAEQDTLVRINWYGSVFYPHEILANNLKLLTGAIHNLENCNLSSGLGKLYQVDNNAYAFMFDNAVYRHFTQYVFDQPRERLKWGFNRHLEHEDLFELVNTLLKKHSAGITDCTDEITYLRAVCGKQKALLIKTMNYLCETMKKNSNGERKYTRAV